MGKAPAFQFYPGDWIQDTRILTPMTRGIWIDMLCFMWRSEERGKLSGTECQLARILSCEKEELRAAIAELSVTKIADVTFCNTADVTFCNTAAIAELSVTKIADVTFCNTDETVIITIINRRMHREDNKRKSTLYRVQKHRNSRAKRECNADVTHPSSSSSSIIDKDITKVISFSSSSVEYRNADLLLQKITERNPNFKKPDLQKWAKDIDLMIRADHRDPETIRAVIEWCQNDSFWQNNILSTKKLRDKFDQLYLKMKGNGNGRDTGRAIKAPEKAGRAWSDGAEYPVDHEF